MKREIKFRAWDKNQMWTLPIDTNYGLHRFFGAISEQANIMQFTGLKDKNGVEVYEGDVVINGDKNIIYVVEWHDCALKCRQIGTMSFIDITCWQKSIEVIGNIYENPELIE